MTAPCSKLFYTEDKTSSRLASNGGGEFLYGFDAPRGILAAAVGEHRSGVFPLEEIKGHVERHFVVGAVDAGHVPRLAAAAGEHTALARIAADEAGLVPGSGQVGKEILDSLRLC